MRASGLRHLCKQALQLIALRRGALGMQCLAADHILDRADQADLCTEAVLQHMLEQIGRGGLAVRAGQADHDHLLRRAAKPVCRGQRECTPRIVHAHIRDRLLRRMLTEHRSRAALHRLGDEPVPVGGKARHGDKQLAGLRRARIVADAGDLRLRVGPQFRYLNVFQQFFQFHANALLSRMHRQS